MSRTPTFDEQQQREWENRRSYGSWSADYPHRGDLAEILGRREREEQENAENTS